jgi:hypothetical protein
MAGCPLFWAARIFRLRPFGPMSVMMPIAMMTRQVELGGGSKDNGLSNKSPHAGMSHLESLLIDMYSTFFP